MLSARSVFAKRHQCRMRAEADVIIIGSGLAGLCCAFELAKRKRKALVLEAEDVIGGRTSSWEEDGMPVESGIHKFLGIYRVLPRVLKEAGVDLEKMLTWVDALELHAADRRAAYFGAAPYHHPILTLKGMLGNGHFIPWSDKLRIASLAMGGLITCASRPAKLDAQSVAEAARACGISDRVLRDLFQTLTTGVLFLPPDEFSAYAAFAPALEALKRGLTMRVGAFNGGMTEVMMRPLADAIERLGGTVQTKSPVTKLLIEGGAISGVEVGRAHVTANAVVLATSLKPAQTLLQRGLSGHSWLKPMLSLPSLSAVTLQCELDHALFPTDHTHFSNTAVCCFGEQSHTTFRHVPGRLSAILYPPEHFLTMDPDAVLRRVETDCEGMGIPLKGHVTRHRVIAHPHDFYAMKPGSEALRPTQETPIPGLTLAGDYTKQPFSASMEGAAISGVRAAEAVLAQG
jgi:15-cis-phytoene desaturase